MRDKGGPRYIWFKLLLVLGSLLGLLLLTQSIRNYRYVSQRLVHEELLREAVRQIVFIERHAREADARDAGALSQLLEEIRQEGAERIAWIRLMDSRGQVLVQSGEAVGAPLAAEDFQVLMESRERFSGIRETPSGEVLVSVHPFRYRFRSQRPGEGQTSRGETPPSRSRPEPPGPGAVSPRGETALRFNMIEMALYLSGAAGEFGSLSRNLIVSVSAALALVASMILLGLRFGNYVRGKQLEQQLDLARRVQQDLLPLGCPACANLDFAAACVPAWQVGGDFYDVFPADLGRVALLLGDVSGKGLSAALLMGLLHGAVRSSYWAGNGAQHEEASRRLNELLCTRTSVERFASLFWCYYDPEAQVLRYVNAGHLPPLVVRGNGAGPAQLRRLEEGGPVLGVISEARYRQGETAFLPGDLLVMYSDGVVEAADANEEEFGEKRLTSVIQHNSSRSSQEIRDEILRQVREFLGGEVPHDDLTLLVARASQGPGANSASSV